MLATRIFGKGVNPKFADPEPDKKIPKFRKMPFKPSDNCDPETENTFKLSTNYLLKEITKTNQYGHREKTKQVFSTPNELCGDFMNFKYKLENTPTLIIPTEKVNESSKTFKYGTHSKLSGTETTDKKLLVRGVQDPYPIKNKFGFKLGDAGVYSGYKGLEINQKGHV